MAVPVSARTTSAPVNVTELERLVLGQRHVSRSLLASTLSTPRGERLICVGQARDVRAGVRQGHTSPVAQQAGWAISAAALAALIATEAFVPVPSTSRTSTSAAWGSKSPGKRRELRAGKVTVTRSRPSASRLQAQCTAAVSRLRVVGGIDEVDTAHRASRSGWTSALRCSRPNSSVTMSFQAIDTPVVLTRAAAFARQSKPGRWCRIHRCR